MTNLVNFITIAPTERTMPARVFDFFGLPNDVLYDILCSRLGLKDLARLDSACCQQLARATLLEIFRSKQFVLNSTVHFFFEAGFSWLSAKNMKASDIELDWMTDFSELEEYLTANGSYLRRVCLETDTTTFVMSLIARHCKNITSLQIEESSLTGSFRDILLNNPNISDLRCQRITCSEPDLLANLTLNKLRVYCVDEGSFLAGFPWSASTHSNSLHTIRWDCTTLSVDALQTLVTNCPQLKTLCCAHVQIEASLFQGLAPKLAGLLNLSIWGNSTVTDEDVLALVRSISSLRVLNIQACYRLTNTSLLHVAEHAGGTLERLYADIKSPSSPETEAILEIFAQKCAKLKYLHIDTRDETLCSGLGTSLLVQGCPELRTLFLDNEDTVCASSVALIAMPNLKILVEDDDQYDMLSFPVC